jgi:hypothetical protein
MYVDNVVKTFVFLLKSKTPLAGRSATATTFLDSFRYLCCTGFRLFSLLDVGYYVSRSQVINVIIDSKVTSRARVSFRVF